MTIDILHKSFTESASDWHTSNQPKLTKYLFRHGIAHMLASLTIEDACKLVTEFGYCIARLQSEDFQGAPALARDAMACTRVNHTHEFVAAWSTFLTTNLHLLSRQIEGWGAHKTLLQLASETVETDPIAQKAEDWLANCDWLWLRGYQGEPTSVLPDRVQEGHTQQVVCDLELLSGEYATACNGGDVFIWDQKFIAEPKVFELGRAVSRSRLLKKQKTRVTQLLQTEPNSLIASDNLGALFELSLADGSHRLISEGHKSYKKRLKFQRRHLRDSAAPPMGIFRWRIAHERDVTRLEARFSRKASATLVEGNALVTLDQAWQVCIDSGKRTPINLVGDEDIPWSWTPFGPYLSRFHLNVLQLLTLDCRVIVTRHYPSSIKHFEPVSPNLGIVNLTSGEFFIVEEPKAARTNEDSLTSCESITEFIQVSENHFATIDTANRIAVWLSENGQLSYNLALGSTPPTQVAAIRNDTLLISFSEKDHLLWNYLSSDSPTKLDVPVGKIEQVLSNGYLIANSDASPYYALLVPSDTSIEIAAQNVPYTDGQTFSYEDYIITYTDGGIWVYSTLAKDIVQSMATDVALESLWQISDSLFIACFSDATSLYPVRISDKAIAPLPEIKGVSCAVKHIAQVGRHVIIVYESGTVSVLNSSSYAEEHTWKIVGKFRSFFVLGTHFGICSQNRLKNRLKDHVYVYSLQESASLMDSDSQNGKAHWKEEFFDNATLWSASGNTIMLKRTLTRNHSFVFTDANVLEILQTYPNGKMESVGRYNLPAKRRSDRSGEPEKVLENPYLFRFSNHAYLKLSSSMESAEIFHFLHHCPEENIWQRTHTETESYFAPLSRELEVIYPITERTAIAVDRLNKLISITLSAQLEFSIVECTSAPTNTNKHHYLGNGCFLFWSQERNEPIKEIWFVSTVAHAALTCIKGSWDTIIDTIALSEHHLAVLTPKGLSIINTEVAEVLSTIRLNSRFSGMTSNSSGGLRTFTHDGSIQYFSLDKLLKSNGKLPIKPRVEHASVVDDKRVISYSGSQVTLWTVDDSVEFRTTAALDESIRCLVSLNTNRYAIISKSGRVARLNLEDLELVGPPENSIADGDLTKAVWMDPKTIITLSTFTCAAWNVNSGQFKLLFKGGTNIRGVKVLSPSSLILWTNEKALLVDTVDPTNNRDIFKLERGLFISNVLATGGSRLLVKTSNGLYSVDLDPDRVRPIISHAAVGRLGRVFSVCDSLLVVQSGLASSGYSLWSKDSPSWMHSAFVTDESVKWVQRIDKTRVLCVFEEHARLISVGNTTPKPLGDDETPWHRVCKITDSKLMVISSRTIQLYHYDAHILHLRTERNFESILDCQMLSEHILVVQASDTEILFVDSTTLDIRRLFNTQDKIKTYLTNSLGSLLIWTTQRLLHLRDNDEVAFIPSKQAPSPDDVVLQRTGGAFKLASQSMLYTIDLSGAQPAAFELNNINVQLVHKLNQSHFLTCDLEHKVCLVAYDETTNATLLGKVEAAIDKVIVISKRYLCILTKTSTLHTWNIETLEYIGVISFGRYSTPWKILELWDCRILLSGPSLEVWCVTTQAKLYTFETPFSEPNNVQILNDQMVCGWGSAETSSNHGHIQIWNIQDGAFLHLLPDQGQPNYAQVEMFGNDLILANDTNRGPRTWSLSAIEASTDQISFEAPVKRVLQKKGYPDGLVFQDRLGRLGYLKYHLEVTYHATPDQHKGPLWRIDNDTVVHYGGETEYVALSFLRKEMNLLRLNQLSVGSVSCRSLGNNRLLTWNAAHDLYLWDMCSGEQLCSFHKHKSRIVNAVVQCEEHLISWDIDGIAFVWSRQSGETISQYNTSQDTALPTALQNSLKRQYLVRNIRIPNQSGYKRVKGEAVKVQSREAKTIDVKTFGMELKWVKDGHWKDVGFLTGPGVMAVHSENELRFLKYFDGNQAFNPNTRLHELTEGSDS